MKITEIKHHKKQYLPLLLLADEQEEMIDRYLKQGTMYILEDHGVKGECVVLEIDENILEIKNIAIDPQFHGQGYGKILIDFIENHYRHQYSILQVGTGDSPLTLPFYLKLGFIPSHRIQNFFIDYYDHPIYENGVQLKDMIYLKKELNKKQWENSLFF